MKLAPLRRENPPKSDDNSIGQILAQVMACPYDGFYRFGPRSPRVNRLNKYLPYFPQFLNLTHPLGTDFTVKLKRTCIGTVSFLYIDIQLICNENISYLM